MPLRFRTEMELRGERLYGDDFMPEEIAEWFDDEREAYADLVSSNGAPYRYSDHAVNARHGFRHLPPAEFAHALGIGSAHGDEFVPIQDRIAEVTIVEPSTALRQSPLTIPVQYREPNPTGELPLPSHSVDLVLCLSVLHHIPNVSTVIGEINRVLREDGFALLREPTVSMGDWTEPRPGLTIHERGIPPVLLRDLIMKTGLKIKHETRYGFPVTSRIARLARVDTYNSAALVRFDEVVCKPFAWNRTYHATRRYQKMRPTAVFYVLTKGEEGPAP